MRERQDEAMWHLQRAAERRMSLEERLRQNDLASELFVEAQRARARLDGA